MTQFELGADCETQLAHARITIETLQMHKATLIKRNDDLRERNAFLMTSAETAQAALAEARAAVRDMTISLDNADRRVNEKDTIISALFLWENDPADIRTFAEFLDDLGKLYPSAKMW